MTATVYAFHRVGLDGSAALRAGFQAPDWSKCIAFGTACAAPGALTGTRTC